MERVILHSDMNNFYASVECMLNPDYKGVPLAVAGDPDKRHGIILAKNEIAKKFGVKTGDVIWEARQKAPGLVVVPPHFDLYMKYSKRMFDLYNSYTDRVEPFGADECWLDMTGCERLFGSGVEVAEKIRERVKKESGLTCSIGVSFNKVFAKLGSDMKKPDATTVITRENFHRKVWVLDVGELLYVGRRTKEALKKLNVFTIGDLALADDIVLKQHLGINGLKIKQYALGNDIEPVREAVNTREYKSMGHGMTAIKDIEDIDAATDLIYYLSERLGKRMRKEKYRGALLCVGIRYADLHCISAQKPLNFPTDSANEIGQAARALFQDYWNGDAVRSITVSLAKLEKIGTEQISMFGYEQHVKYENLDKALDKIKSKYGNDAICRASELGRDFLYDKNEAEDFLPFQR